MSEATPAAYDFVKNAPEGSADTAREIAQQPAVWKEVAAIIENQGESLAHFLAESGLIGSTEATLVLTGAGSSAYIGNSIATIMKERLGREVLSVPTTDFVTHPWLHFQRGRNYVIVHFARSGDSPESLATFRLLHDAPAEMKHIVITCNADGALYREARNDESSYAILLPDATNDRSLVMTSSFTSMALAALGLCYVPDKLEEFAVVTQRISTVTDALLKQWVPTVQRFLEHDYRKALYLGSNVLGRLGQEASLKMQEMTAGKVVSQSETYLGVRHGPMVFADNDCLAFASLATDPKVRRYELDLLRELRRKSDQSRILAITSSRNRDGSEIVDEQIVLDDAEAEVSDDLRLFTDLVVYQLAGYFACQGVGLNPDNPNEDGVITRVVQGVRIYGDEREQL